MKRHPDVRGMAKNVFFLSHNHRENAGEDDAISKFNQFEVNFYPSLKDESFYGLTWVIGEYDS